MSNKAIETAGSQQAVITNNEDIVLEVQDLVVHYVLKKSVVEAVNGVSFKLKKKRAIGLVGETGAGKTTTALAIMNLVPDPPGVIKNGKITVCGKDMLSMKPHQLEKIRGKDISMIFQEPVSCLNPFLTVGEQISEVIRLHRGADKKSAAQEALEMLKLVRISSPEKRMNQYPHELSGGMCQRVMIAMALASRPSLLIADEPTTALDVTVQAQILELIKDLKNKLGTAILLISHDMGVIAEMAQRVLVIYAGKAMEYADVRSIFKKPRHPYTVDLLKCVQRTEQLFRRQINLNKAVLDPVNVPLGCRFHFRCPDVKDICILEEPPIIDFDGGKVRCWKYAEELKGERA